MELISPSPFIKALLGHFVPAGTTRPSGQPEQGVKGAQEWEKHLWEAGVIPLHTPLHIPHTPHFFPWCFSSLCPYHPPGHKARILKIHQQLS